MANLNKLRQNNPHWQPEDGDKDYKEWANKANKSEEMKESRNAYDKQHIKECPLDPVEEAKTLIVDKITKHFSDYLFEMINDEMSNSYVFQVDNYLTSAGFDEPVFEEAWFEFFHEHHGDIMYEVMQNVTN